jgi:hypothetical protein
MVSTIPVDQNQGPTQLGGRRKKGNGHKANCKCPICKNMKRGGSEDPMIETVLSGGEKKNGHKSQCKCPICINMKYAKGSKNNRHNKRGETKKNRRGGGDKDELDETTHGMDNEVELDKTQHGMDEDSSSHEETEKTGGRRNKKGKKNRGNGHKPNCKCPICKNMRKSKRGGDIEDQKEEKADDDDYDELDSMEKRKVNVEEITQKSDTNLHNMEKEHNILETSNNDSSSFEEANPNSYNQGEDEKFGGKYRTRKHKSRRHKKHTRKHMRR